MTPGRTPNTPRESATDKQRRVWDKTAPAYDRQIALFEKIWFPGTREWVGGRATGRVLEVAVGTGLNLAHYPADVRLTALELSPEMLARARDEAARLGRDVDLREGDAEDLPFDDGSFDTVVCALALCSIPDPARAIGEMRRVIVPGGQLLLVDHVASTFPPLHALQWIFEQGSRRAMGEYFTRRQRPLVEAAGFRVEEAERMKLGTVERIRAVRPA